MLRRCPRHGDRTGADLSRVHSPRLEPARPADAPRLAALSRRFIEDGLGWRWRPGAIGETIRDEHSRVVVARGADPDAEDGIAGFAAMSFDFEVRRAHLLLLAVVPARRRRGLGRALYEWLELLALRGGAQRVHLEVRERAGPARALYAQLGFVETARLPGYYQGRETALRLEKAIGRREARAGQPPAS